MSVHYPETSKRYEHYRKKKDLVIIKYGAVWCGPCKQITPLMEQLAAENSDIYFLDVSVDNNQIAIHPDFNDIRNIPHFKFFLNGELVKSFVKADEEKLKRYTKRYSEKYRKQIDENSQKDNIGDINLNKTPETKNDNNDEVVIPKLVRRITKSDLLDTPTLSDDGLYMDYYLETHEENLKLMKD